MHTHPFMELVLNGTAVSIPSNLGIDTTACPNAMHLLHTHDTSGKLHVEGYDAFTPTAEALLCRLEPVVSRLHDA